MKIKKLMALMAILAIMVSCSKSNDEDTIKKNEMQNFKLTKTEYKGCFDKSSLNYNNQISDDTLFYTIKGDTLILNVKMNYNCCGILKDSVVLGANKVEIFISDICAIENGCECFCTCNFDFEYYFENCDDLNCYVYLKRLNENTYSFWDKLIN